MPSGGASLTAVAVLSSGMNLVSLSASFEDYAFERDAALTDPNSEHAMSKERPSTFGMFVETAGALLSSLPSRTKSARIHF